MGTKPHSSDIIYNTHSATAQNTFFDLSISNSQQSRGAEQSLFRFQKKNLTFLLSKFDIFQIFVRVENATNNGALLYYIVGGGGLKTIGSETHII